LAHHKRTFSQSSVVVNFAWYPGASSSNAPAYCFVASVRDCPVKLLDASDGRLRASYQIIDHRERFIAPHSLALYCDIRHTQPGEGDRLPTTPSEKSKDGLTPSSQAMDNIVLYSESNQAAIMPIGGAYSHSGVTQACRLEN
ncbi:hypothetical protein DFJ58DRAFT_818377, partial [Suillus subalutaceus]|uniref:uncharacterized protein n=1 Tax=Suillus subalutaceus TaxID=48586 RepID=UPI001B87BBF8